MTARSLQLAAFAVVVVTAFGLMCWPVWSAR